MPLDRRCTEWRASRDDLAPGLRIVPFEHSAVIAYHVADAVEIVNTFYGGRNYEALFRVGDDGDEA